jgi:flagellar motor switch protein FliM
MPETSSQFGGSRPADVVRRRLGASKVDAPVAVDPADVRDFDWTMPCLYTSAERARLDAFAERAMSDVRTALVRALRSDVPLTSRPPAVAYVHQVQGEGSCYALPLCEGSAVAGVLRIDAPFACGCVERLLGGAGQLSGQDRELSPLESSLLRDLAAALCDAFARAYGDVGGPPLAAAGEVVKNRLPLSVSPEHEVVQFALAQAGQSRPAVTIVFPHERIDFLAAGLPGPMAEPSPDECRARLIAALNAADIQGEVWLRPVGATINSVLALEPGDVLLLPQGLGEPVEMTIRGRKLFEARLGTQRGQYAVEILSVH